MYSSSSSSMDMGEGIAFVSPPALPVAAEESSPPPAIPIVVRSPLHHQQEAPTTTEAGRDQDQHGANSAHTIAKGKRTKRPRTSPPSAAHQQPTPTSSASNSCYSGGSGAITEEEEDMANCLILLAQGDPNGAAVNNIKQHEERATGNAGRATSRRFAETSGCASTKTGFYVYECKTCSRCFSTFQALGGHRASHKKPKVESCYGVGGHHDVLLESEEKTRPLEHVMIDEHHRPQQEQRPSMLESQIKPTTTTARMLESQIKPTTTTAPSTPSKITHNNISNAAVMNNNISTITNNKSTATARIHECSICGSEFQSGQALGGHMRRHRAAAAVAAAVPASPPSQLSQQVLLPLQKPAEPTTKSVVLPLDLNLPAPSEDADFPKAASPASLPPPTFPFSVPSKRPPMLFSASPLVDCHY